MYLDVTHMDINVIDGLLDFFGRGGIVARIERKGERLFLFFDERTKIYPNKIFDEFFQKELERRKRYGVPFSVIKCIGDEKKIAVFVRSSDIVGRDNGNVLVLLPNTDEKNTNVVKKRFEKHGIKIIETKAY